MRIVSLLPSTTEILHALGVGDQVVGVTFECDYPAVAREARIVSTSALPEGLTPSEIDAWVSQARGAGEDLYHLDSGALAELDPDLIVTQDLCAVCAVDVSVVSEALSYLGARAEVATTDPKTLEQVWESILTLGATTGRDGAAQELVSSLRHRLAGVRDRVDGLPRPRVMLLEWVDPPFAPGHWIPEMIEAAGGTPVLATPGADSRRTTWEAILGAEPEVVVVAPCGFDLDGATAQADELRASGRLPHDVTIHAVDANASWARPGPRLVDGVEELADLLHPNARDRSGGGAGSYTI